MSVRRRFARDAAILSAQAVFTRLVGMVTSIVLARGLGAAGLGVLNAVQATTLNAYGFGRLGIDVATHVHLAEADVATSKKRQVLAAAALIMSASGIACALLVWAGADWLAREVFGDPSLARWLRFAPLLVIAQFGHIFAYSALAGVHRFAPYARVAAAIAVSTLAATGAGIWLAGLRGALIATVAVALAGTSWLLAGASRELRRAGVRPVMDGARKAAADLFRLGGPFYLTGLVLIPVAYVLQGLLTRTGGLEQMGYLRVMLSLGAIISFIPASLGGATISSLVQLRTAPEQDHDYQRHAALNLRAVWLFCLLSATVLAIGLEAIVNLLFGNDYTRAVPAFRWGLFGSLLLAVEGVVTQILLASRRVWLLFVLLSGRAIVWVSLGYLLVPRAAALGYLAADALSLALFVPLGVAACVKAASERGRTRDGARLAALAFLTACGAAAVLPAWSPTARTFLSVASLLLTLTIGLLIVLNREERAAALSIWPFGRPA